MSIINEGIASIAMLNIAYKVTFKISASFIRFNILFLLEIVIVYKALTTIGNNPIKPYCLLKYPWYFIEKESDEVL